MSGSIASYNYNQMKFIISKIQDRAKEKDLEDFLARCEKVFPQYKGNWWGDDTIAHLIIAMMGRVDNKMIHGGYISNVPLYICVHSLLYGFEETKGEILSAIDEDKREEVEIYLNKNNNDDDDECHCQFNRSEKSAIIHALKTVPEESLIEYCDIELLDSCIKLYLEKPDSDKEITDIKNRFCLDGCGFLDRENFKFNHNIWLNYYELVEIPDLYPVIAYEDDNGEVKEKRDEKFHSPITQIREHVFKDKAEWKKAYNEYINDYAEVARMTIRNIGSKN